MVQGSEVVITGAGVVTPIGIGREAFWGSLCAGRSGVDLLPVADGNDLPVKFGAEIKDFDARQFVKPRKSLKVMCREIQLGFSAAVLALEDGGLSKGEVDPDRFGVVFGSEMFYCDINELADAYRKCVVDGELTPDLWGEGAMSDLYPLWMLKYLPNMTACHVGIAQDARGPNNTIVLDEVSYMLSVIESVATIQRGAADVMIAGASGSRINLTRILYRGDSTWSHRNDDPPGASRPFDADRDGGVPGEGGGAIILESRRHAQARGANILASVLGYGSGFEKLSNPRGRPGDSVRQSIDAALRSAGLAAAGIGHVGAHGASMVVPDQIEAQAIRDCLGDTPVTALKSYFGCLASGTGAAEMAGSILAIAEGEVPRTLNYERPDPACPVNVIRDEPLRTNSTVAMVLSQALTGQAAAVVIAGA